MASLNTFILCTCLVLQCTTIQCHLKNPKVIIIGAGVSGITTGFKLVNSGVTDVKILEAENRIGGRVHTVEFEDTTLELGCQSLNVEEDDAIFELANKTNLLKLTQLNVTESDFIEMNGNHIPKETSLTIQSIFDEILNDLETMTKYNKSVREIVKKRLEENEELHKIDKNLIDKYFEWYMKEQMTYLAVESMNEMPSKAYAEYYSNSFNKVWVWKSPGMKTLFDALMGKFLNTEIVPLEEKIILNKRVTNVNWSSTNKTNIIVKCNDGSQFVADHVIVTVPLGVLKEHIDTLFTPELPELKKTAIKFMGYGTTDIVYLKFAHRWWPKEFHGFSFLWNNNSADSLRETFGDKYDNKKWITSLTGFYSVDFHDNVLAGYLAGNNAKYVETLTDSEVLNGCLDALKLFVGKKYKIPESLSIIRSKWYTNSNFRGVNSYKSNESFEHNVGPTQLAESLYSDGNNPAVLFAGEATSLKHYATVHGAIESGWNVALDILHMYE